MNRIIENILCFALGALLMLTVLVYYHRAEIKREQDKFEQQIKLQKREHSYWVGLCREHNDNLIREIIELEKR
jgi:hypothetical protein